MSWSKMIDRWQKNKQNQKEMEESKETKGYHVNNDNVWIVEDDAKKCNVKHVSEVEPVITIGPAVVQKVQSLTLMIKDTEFLVYLFGNCTCKHVLSKHGEFGKDPCNVCTETGCKSFSPDDNHRQKRIVTDVYIPTQTVTGGSVDMEGDDNIPPGIIGALHKHPGDGHTRFSCIDDEKLNVNHWLSIVIPSSAALPYWYGTAKLEYACGCREHESAKLKFAITTPDIKSASARITKGSYLSKKSTTYVTSFDTTCDECGRKFKSSKALSDHQKTKGHSQKDLDTDREFGMGYGMWD